MPLLDHPDDKNSVTKPFRKFGKGVSSVRTPQEDSMMSKNDNTVVAVRRCGCERGYGRPRW